MHETLSELPRRVWLTRMALGAIGWLVLWVCVRQFIFVWFLMMGVYLLCIGFAGSALAVCPSYVSRYRVKLAGIFKTSEWFILSGLISFPVYVIGFFVLLWFIGEEL